MISTGIATHPNIDFSPGGEIILTEGRYPGNKIYLSPRKAKGLIEALTEALEVCGNG